MCSSDLFATDPFEVVLGAEVADALHYKLGDKLVLAHGVAAISLVKHDDKPFTVVGILARTGTPVDRSVHISLSGIEAEARGGRIGPAQALALQAGALRVGQAQAADAVAVGRAPAFVCPAVVRDGAGSARWAAPSRRRVFSCG